MRMWGTLNGKEESLIKDLKRTTLSFGKLGEKYSVSRQAIHAFCKTQKVKRKPRGHQVDRCPLCRKLIQISRRPYSAFISIPTIIRETRELRARCLSHLQILRDIGLIEEKFGRIRSSRVERAYSIYFKNQLPIRTIGRKVGLKNFPSVIRKHRLSGWKIPPPIMRYGMVKKKFKSQIQMGEKRIGGVGISLLGEL